MGFFQPVAFLAGLALPAILAFYFLRLRRNQRKVSSVFLWERLLEEQRANAPWQKLRKSLLLLLQLLLAASLVIALARPYHPASGGLERLVVVLLDASASMRATDVEPTRFEAARREVEFLIGGLGPRDRMALVAFGREPVVLAGATADRQLLRNVLAGAAPSYEPGDLQKAIDLGVSLVKETPGAAVVLITDGAGHEPPRFLEGVDFFVRRVGGGTFNLALTNLATRRDGEDLSALATLVNFDDRSHEVRVSLWGDGQPLAARTVNVQPGAEEHLMWTGLPSAEVLHGRIEVEDALAGDNQAWTVTKPARSSRILLVSAGNLFLERALALHPGVDLFKIAPGEVSGWASSPQEVEESRAGLPDLPEGYDLYVFDRFLPVQWPRATLLVIGPPAGSPLLPAGELVRVAGEPMVAVAHPVTASLDLNEVYVAAARQVGPAGDWKTAFRAGQVPLLLLGENEGSRRAVITFQLAHTNLPLRPAFPILVNNLLNWLLPPAIELPAGAEPGLTLRLNPGTVATSIDIITPRGERLKLVSPFWDKSLRVEEPGMYTVLVDAANIQQSVAVNFPVAESDLRPRGLTEPVGQMGDHDVEKATNRETWTWFAWLGLVFLLGEWWVYSRGH